MSGPWTRQRVLGAFRSWEAEQPEQSVHLDAESRSYVAYHATRYAQLLEAVAELAGRIAPAGPLHVLDVGPNIQTVLLRRAYPTAVVDTLGFAHPAAPAAGPSRHVNFDLNQVIDRGRWPDPGRRYDIIVMAEVLEHLHVPPHLVLGFLAEQLRPPGYVLLQTPNAAALHKRLALLAGRNPVEAPRACQENPGHIHEYTLAELRQEVTAGGLRIEWLRAENYFGSAAGAQAYRVLGRLFPATWRHGVTICAHAGD